MRSRVVSATQTAKQTTKQTNKQTIRWCLKSSRTVSTLLCSSTLTAEPAAAVHSDCDPELERQGPVNGRGCCRLPVPCSMQSEMPSTRPAAKQGTERRLHRQPKGRYMASAPARHLSDF